MGEFQKVAIGLLGMSHPEIYRLSSFAAETVEPAPQRPASQASPSGKAVSALKVALAALLTGSRAIPLGDNARLTRELGEYKAHLKGC
jgi:hypothetical protein